MLGWIRIFFNVATKQTHVKSNSFFCDIDNDSCDFYVMSGDPAEKAQDLDLIFSSKWNQTWLEVGTSEYFTKSIFGAKASSFREVGTWFSRLPVG